MSITTRRVLLVAGGLVALVLVVLVVLATRTYDSPELTRTVLGALSSDDLQLDAERVVLRPLRGVELYGVDATSRLPGGLLSARVDTVILSHDLSRLLAGEILVDEVVLSGADASIVWDAVAAPRLAPETAPQPDPTAASNSSPGDGEAVPPGADDALDLSLRVRRFSIEDSTFTMSETIATPAATPAASDPTVSEMVRFEGLDLELHDITIGDLVGGVSPLLAATADGEVRAERLITPALVAEDARGTVRLSGGHVLLDALQLPTAFGPLAVDSLDLALDTEPYTYTLEGGGRPLDAQALLGASSGFGPGALRFAVRGDGSDDGGLAGEGSLSLESGTLGDMPALVAIEQLLATTELIGRPYDPFRIDFRIDGDLVDVAPFQIVAGNMSLGGGGTVDLTGPMAMRLELSLPRADVDVDEIPNEVIEALTDVDGRVKLPLLVAGSIEAPKVTFDRSAWGQLVGRRLADEAGKAISRGLLKLLGDDDEGEEPRR